MESRIKTELIDKEHGLWNKDSIDFLVSMFEHKKYNDLYNSNLVILDNYIKWYKNNSGIETSHKMYKLDHLKHIYCLIHNDMYSDDMHDDYITRLHELDYTMANSLLFNYDTFGLIMMSIFMIFVLCKHIFSLFINKKIEEKKYVFEFLCNIPKIPEINTIPQVKNMNIDKIIPENLLDNPLIKMLLEKFNMN